MATYPTTLVIAPKGEGTGSGDTWRDPLLLSEARSGTARGRRLAAAKKRVWNISHVRLTSAQKTTLEAFYDANRSVSFTFSILGANYTVIFSEELQWEGLPGALWNVRVVMREV